MEALCTSGRSQQLGMLAWMSLDVEILHFQVKGGAEIQLSCSHPLTSLPHIHAYFLHMHMPKQPGGKEDTWKLKETST